MGFIEGVDIPIPLLIIPMTSKSYDSYNNIFITLKTLLENLKIKKNYEKSIIVVDYETALRNSIIKNFPNAKLEGCYFHYIKNLWMYAKKHALCTKTLFNKTRILIFCFKIYPYFLNEQKRIFSKII